MLSLVDLQITVNTVFLFVPYLTTAAAQPQANAVSKNWMMYEQQIGKDVAANGCLIISDGIQAHPGGSTTKISQRQISNQDLANKTQVLLKRPHCLLRACITYPPDI